MTHVKQNGPECYLATIAMLTGRPIETIRKEANTIAKLLGVKRGGYLYLLRGRGWMERTRRQQVWRLLERIFVKRYGIPECPILTPGNFAPTWMIKAEELDLTREGMLLVRWTTGAHAVAFSEGLVYDGNFSNPMPFTEWWNELRTRHGRKLTGLIVREANQKDKGLFFCQ